MFHCYLQLIPIASAQTDPGVPIVYAGFGALLLTTCISFLSHTQVIIFPILIPSMPYLGRFESMDEFVKIGSELIDHFLLNLVIYVYCCGGFHPILESHQVFPLN